MDKPMIQNAAPGNPVGAAGQSSPQAIPAEALAQPVPAMSWRKRAQQVHVEARFFYFAFKHPRTPWYARLIAACTAGYLLSPVQLIPSFIPGIGFLDDLAVLYLGAKLLRKTLSPDVLKECRDQAEAIGIHSNNVEKSTLTDLVPVAVVAFWLLAAVAANTLLVAWFHN
jgi:uncharacterized membrane protein YkvA (DUF1232 family)